MKVKTRELTGELLDWAVGECEFRRRITAREHVKAWVLEAHKAGQRTDPYSADWLWGGPIIDRMWASGEFLMATAENEVQVTFIQGARIWSVYGPTPLIAACRCYVASELGMKVDVPEELLS